MVDGVKDSSDQSIEGALEENKNHVDQEDDEDEDNDTSEDGEDDAEMLLVANWRSKRI